MRHNKHENMKQNNDERIKNNNKFPKNRFQKLTKKIIIGHIHKQGT